jgi:glucuronoarabinoxylan endo-1,4-beta-xylanase
MKRKVKISKTAKLFFILFLMTQMAFTFKAQSQIQVNRQTTKQTIWGFGGCANHPVQDLKTRLSVADQNIILDKLFRTDGNNAGLSIIRLEINGFRKTDPDPNAREQYTFEPSDGVWDWNTDQYQRWFAQEAINRSNGVHFLACPWSPPGWMKTNNSPINGGSLNTAYYDKYATYLKTYVDHYRNVYGFDIRWVSVQNEPTNSTPYASCTYSTSAMDIVAAKVADAIHSLNQGVYVGAPEGATRGISAGFMSAMSATTKGKLDYLLTHDYGGASSAISGYGKPVINTEVWSENYGADDLTITDGLRWANAIKDALVSRSEPGWLYWWLVDPNGGAQGIIPIKADGTYTIPKRLYTMGQFSRFMREGDVRVDATSSNGNLAVVASKNAAGTASILVINNSTGAITSTVSGLSASTLEVYRTSSTENLTKLSNISTVSNSASVTFAAKSVTTLVEVTDLNPVLTTITVSPASASITAGLTQQFTAVGKDQNGTVMAITPTWSVTGGGSVSSSGLYTSATAGGPFTVSATVGSISGSAQVTVTPVPVLTTITVTPATATIFVGQSQQFTAVGKDQFGNVMAIVPTWTSTCGPIIQTGLYTPVSAGTCTICAAVGTVQGCATIIVKEAPVLTTITVTPATTAITVGQTQQYTAVGKDQYGTTMTIAPTWSVTGGGTISTSGLYTATTEGGPFTVSATVGVVAGTAQVTVNPAPVSQTIQAESYTSMFGVQTEATADAGGGANVGWIIAGDWMIYSVSIPQTGTYSAKFRVAGWTATGTFALQNAANTTLANVSVPNGGTGAYQVWSTVSGSNTFQLAAGTQNMRIYATGPSWNLNWFELKLEAPSVLTTITVTPSPASVMSTANQQFTAVGKDQYGNVMVIAPTWSVTGGGTINASTGLFTATTVGGPFAATASVGSVTGSASVTVTPLIVDPLLMSYFLFVDKWTADYMRPTGGLATSAITQYESATVPTATNFQWEFRAAPTAGYYYILNKGTGNAIQPTGASVTDGTGISQVALTTANQNNTELQWVMQASDEAGYYWIKNRKSGLYIRPTAGTNGTGIAIVQNALVTAYSSFKWSLVSQGLKSAGGEFSMDEISGNGVLIYPNPASQNVFVELGAANYSTLEILTLSGRKVISQAIEGKESIDIDLTNLNKGLYIISLKGSGFMHNEKLIIK